MLVKSFLLEIKALKIERLPQITVIFTIWKTEHLKKLPIDEKFLPSEVLMNVLENESLLGHKEDKVDEIINHEGNETPKIAVEQFGIIFET